MNRIGILGTGGMGTALALLLSRSPCSVRLWGRDSERVREIASTRVNRRHLPEITLPDAIAITASIQEATTEADLLVIAVPTAYLRAVLGEIGGDIPRGIPALSVVKGIENRTFARPSEIIVEALGPRPVAILSGPSHAEELARGLPASVVVAGGDMELCIKIRDTLNHSMLRVYSNPDALGVELAGALKNILGIAAGICDGLGFGDNAKAALLTRGLAEITRFGTDLGAHASTFYGLAGVGDLITTCFSRFGRNRLVGERIGRGETLEHVLGDMVNVAEGVFTTRSVHDQAQSRGVDVPITDELYEILFNGKSPRDAVSNLMVRMPKGEWEP